MQLILVAQTVDTNHWHVDMDKLHDNIIMFYVCITGASASFGYWGGENLNRHFSGEGTLKFKRF